MAKATRAKSAIQNALQELHKAWVRELERSLSASPSRVASDADLSPSTLTRIFNEGYSGALAELTIRTIREKYGVIGPDEWNSAGRPPLRGLAEEATEYQFGEDPGQDAAIRGLMGKREGIFVMTLRTRSLEDAGYLPGDVVLLDQTREPQDRDIVCAQVYEGGGATTIWRRYDAPFLTDLTRDADKRRAPEIVDDRRVRIVGVVTDMYRRRQRAA